MSVFKASTGNPMEDVEMFSKMRAVVNEINKLREVIGEPMARVSDLICESIEEYTVINEYRKSKINYQLQKLAQLKKLCKFSA